MKDTFDTVTVDGFQEEEEITYQEVLDQQQRDSALYLGGHYQAVLPCKYYAVTGNRYNGTTTPDVVRDAWMSPKEVIQWLENRYGKYDLDAAADAGNAVCEKFFDEKLNCLKRWWGKNKHVYLNPPYSHIDPFVTKAIEQLEHGNQIDMLLPADPTTAWFYDAMKSAAEIIFITGEVKQHSYTGKDGEILLKEISRTGRLAFTSALTGKPVQGNNKGSVIFVMRRLLPGEIQQTHYIPISEICPSVNNRVAKARSVKC